MPGICENLQEFGTFVTSFPKMFVRFRALLARHTDIKMLVRFRSLSARHKSHKAVFELCYCNTVQLYLN